MRDVKHAQHRYITYRASRSHISSVWTKRYRLAVKAAQFLARSDFRKSLQVPHLEFILARGRNPIFAKANYFDLIARSKLALNGLRLISFKECDSTITRSLGKESPILAVGNRGDIVSLLRKLLFRRMRQQVHSPGPCKVTFGSQR